MKAVTAFAACGAAAGLVCPGNKRKINAPDALGSGRKGRWLQGIVTKPAKHLAVVRKRSSQATSASFAPMPCGTCGGQTCACRWRGGKTPASLHFPATAHNTGQAPWLFGSPYGFFK